MWGRSAPGHGTEAFFQRPHGWPQTRLLPDLALRLMHLPQPHSELTLSLSTPSVSPTSQFCRLAPCASSQKRSTQIAFHALGPGRLRKPVSGLHAVSSVNHRAALGWPSFAENQQQRPKLHLHLSILNLPPPCAGSPGTGGWGAVPVATPQPLTRASSPAPPCTRPQPSISAPAMFLTAL